MPLVVSMSTSVDGFVADRTGDFGWSPPDAERFAFHLQEVGAMTGLLLGRRLYETMRVWEEDPTFPDSDDEHAFAAVWSALPKVVFSTTLDRVAGNARLARGTLAEEVAAVLADTEGDVEVGGADLARQAIELDLVDELRIFRCPVLVGGGNPLLPPVRDRRALELVEVRTFPGGVIYERWRRLR